MEPLLTDITADPELISGIRPWATSTEGVPMFLLVLIIQGVFLILRRWWCRLCRLCLSHLLLKDNRIKTSTINISLH
jgi:hypothetical protein